MSYTVYMAAADDLNTAYRLINDVINRGGEDELKQPGQTLALTKGELERLEAAANYLLAIRSRLIDRCPMARAEDGCTCGVLRALTGRMPAPNGHELGCELAKR